MSKPKKESFFWTSYSDLMTSLFFVMLVLFVLVIVLLHNKMKATEAQLLKIKEIEKSIENIDSTYFKYDPTYKRHTLDSISISFRPGSADTNDISIEDRRKLRTVGRSIQRFVKKAENENPDVKYLLIIEGQSSISPFRNEDQECRNNDVLSYRRALSLLTLWENSLVLYPYQDRDQDPDREAHKYIVNPNICEVIISGSGTRSPFREPEYLSGGSVNPANQRFVIHIIPKPGTIK
jgi:hypothetical protein